MKASLVFRTALVGAMLFSAIPTIFSATNTEACSYNRNPDVTKINFDQLYELALKRGKQSGTENKPDSGPYDITYQNDTDRCGATYIAKGKVHFDGGTTVTVWAFWLDPFGKAGAVAYVSGQAPVGMKQSVSSRSTDIDFWSVPLPGISIPLPIPHVTGNGSSPENGIPDPLAGTDGRIETDPINHPPGTQIRVSKSVDVVAFVVTRRRSSGRAFAFAEILAINSQTNSKALEFTPTGN